MSSGARLVTAYAKQTDAAVVPQSGWKVLPTISNGLTVSNELTNSEMITGGRIAAAGMITSGEVSGDIESELQYSTYDDLLAGAFFNNWTIGTGSPDTLTIGDIKQLFAITKDFQDINVNHLFTGCIVNSLSIEVTTDSLVKVTFGIMANGYQHSKTASFAVSPAVATQGKAASGLSIGTILKDGVDIGICVESFTFEIDNQAEIHRCLGDNLYGGNILAMLANASGSLTLAYGVASHDLVVNQLTGATVALEVPIEYSETDKYVIKLPQIQVSGEIPSPSGTDLATIDVSYTVVNESPILERHHA